MTKKLISYTIEKPELPTISELVKGVTYASIEDALIRIFDLDVEDIDNETNFKYFKRAFFKMYNVVPNPIEDKVVLQIMKTPYGNALCQVGEMDKMIDPPSKKDWDTWLGFYISEDTLTEMEDAEIVAILIDILTKEGIPN